MKTYIWRILMLFIVLGLGWWLASATEWQDVEITSPPQGAAANDDLYGLSQLLRRLGMQVQAQPSLATLPPPQARLVLLSDGGLLPGASARLQQWVKQGGHLVIPSNMISNADLIDWLPVRTEEALTSEAPQPDGDDCRTLTPAPATPDQGVAAGLQICLRYGHTSQYLPASTKTPVLWSLKSLYGTEALRVGLGQGSVTVVGPWGAVHNTKLLRADHALLAAAVLQAHAGATLWFIQEGARQPFVLWLWQKAWVAVVLALLALSLALWRSALRFGPLIPQASPHRRAMAEQVRGTARFLQQHGGQALHAAQLRAVHEAAQRYLPRFAQMDSAARSKSLAEATGLDLPAVARALATYDRQPAMLALDVELLETARRRLQARAMTPNP